MTAESHTLNEQVVLVTGAAQGLGKATALAFARRGARLFAAAVKSLLASLTALSAW